jgi:TPP-dependent pyruvate/acetoin dehydrogenase alpha subunit
MSHADEEELLHRMWLIRCFEDEVQQLFTSGAVRGSTTCTRAKRRWRSVCARHCAPAT